MSTNNKMNVLELKKLAKERGVPGYYKLKKDGTPFGFASSFSS